MTIVVYAHRYKRPPPLPADVTLVQLDPSLPPPAGVPDGPGSAISRNGCLGHALD